MAYLASSGTDAEIIYRASRLDSIAICAFMARLKLIKILNSAEVMLLQQRNKFKGRREQ